MILLHERSKPLVFPLYFVYLPIDISVAHCLSICYIYLMYLWLQIGCSRRRRRLTLVAGSPSSIN